MLIVMIAGSAAEKVVLENILPNGYSGDLAALKLCYPEFPEDPDALLKEGMREALRLVHEHRAEIEAVAEQLLAVGRMTGSEVDAIIERL
jgi:hypothetical protein